VSPALVHLPEYLRLSDQLDDEQLGFDYATLSISPAPFWAYLLLSFVSLALAERLMDNPGGLMDFAVWGQIMSLPRSMFKSVTSQDGDTMEVVHDAAPEMAATDGGDDVCGVT
jgi:hypothetical protein